MYSSIFFFFEEDEVTAKSNETKGQSLKKINIFMSLGK
jgi:hypothetical protein